MKRAASGLLAAWVFLTRIPLPASDLDERDFERAPAFYPFVGVLIGALGAAAFALGWAIGGGFVAAILATAATLLATGAFHEDGLADLFDGLGAPSAERMMEIMRDSRLGTFGAAALFTVLLLKIAALSQLPYMWALCALPVAHGVSRLSAVVVIATSRYARAEGMAKPVARGISTGPLILAGLTGAVALAAFVPVAGLGSAVCATAGVAIGHIGIRLLFERKLGGYTGDCLGAVQQASELGFYLGVLAWL